MSNLRYLFTRFIYVAKRKAYALRLLVPGLRRLHKLEVIVGPRGYWYELRSYQLEVLTRNGLTPSQTLLDFGCGPMQGGVAFIQYLDSGNYVGLDNNADNLDAAYSELYQYRLSSKNPLLIYSNDLGKDLLRGRQFDMIWASQILYYFDDTNLENLFTQLSETLKPNGKILFDIVGECIPEYKTRNHIKWMQSVHLHTLESIKTIAEPLGYEVRSLGELQNYGYPRGLNLHTNILIELMKPQFLCKGTIPKP